MNNYYLLWLMGVDFLFREIKKRSGKVVKFNPQKITDAIYKANLEAIDETFHKDELEKITKEIINSLPKNKVPTVEGIQDVVEKILIKRNHASTAKAYIIYRSDRGKIRRSKLDLMEIYKELTFSDAIDVDIKRENANIDADTAMGTMLKYGSEGSKYFITSNILPKDISEAHISGDIHIHDMDFYMLTETCCQIDLLKLFKKGFSTGHGYLREPNDIRSYSALACIAIQANQNEMHGGQAVPMFDYCMAPGVKKTFKKHYFKALSHFLSIKLDFSKEDADLLVKKIKQELGEDITMAEEKNYLDKLVAFLPPHQRSHNFAEIDEDLTKKAHNFAYNSALDETDKATYQAMEAFIHNLNTMNSRAGAQVPFSSINYGTDTSLEGQMVIKNLLLATMAGLGNGETPIFPVQIFKVKEGINYNKEDKNYTLFQLAMKTSAKRLFPNFSFLDAPFNKAFYEEGNYNSEVAYMGCRTRVMGNTFDKSRQQTCGRGNLSFTSINLPRLAIESGGNLEKFYKSLDEMMDLVIRQLIHRYKIQGNKRGKNYPFLMGQNIWLDSDNIGPEDKLDKVLRHGTLTVGFIGLAETLKALLGKHHGESEEAQKLGLEIISFMRKKMDDESEKMQMNFSLIATPAEGLSGRFVKMDKKKYGTIEGVTDKEYYTNSFHVPVKFKISAYEKLKIEAPYHNLTNGGHISYVEMDGDPSKNLVAFEKIIRLMHDLGIGYGSINHPVDRDPVCGYTGIINGTCPKCGRTEEEHSGHLKIKRLICK